MGQQWGDRIDRAVTEEMLYDEVAAWRKGDFPLNLTSKSLSPFGNEGIMVLLQPIQRLGSRPGTATADVPRQRVSRVEDAQNVGAVGWVQGGQRAVSGAGRVEWEERCGDPAHDVMRNDLVAQDAGEPKEWVLRQNEPEVYGQFMVANLGRPAESMPEKRFQLQAHGWWHAQAELALDDRLQFSVKSRLIALHPSDKMNRWGSAAWKEEIQRLILYAAITQRTAVIPELECEGSAERGWQHAEVVLSEAEKPQEYICNYNLGGLHGIGNPQTSLICDHTSLLSATIFRDPEFASLGFLPSKKGKKEASSRNSAAVDLKKLLKGRAKSDEKLDKAAMRLAGNRRLQGLARASAGGQAKWLAQQRKRVPAQQRMKEIREGRGRSGSLKRGESNSQLGKGDVTGMSSRAPGSGLNGHTVDATLVRNALGTGKYGEANILYLVKDGELPVPNQLEEQTRVRIAKIRKRCPL
ncbi:hypothetical protein CYMTET_21352 [Cymbomonas tetramitiformis]|uniref:Uncharacterized protein n=1 Tax=Cymbomonas tetramitiformis TaxID=36881 RepID=A0AAE0G2Z7_9CHLO|nr:hypothetical protein CYMTET_21352 [Cymbomonas tetramitiformis]